MTDTETNIEVARVLGWTIHQIETLGQADVAILPPGVAYTGDNVFKYAGVMLPSFTSDWNTRKEMLEYLERNHFDAKFSSWIAHDKKFHAWDILSLSQPDFCHYFLEAAGVKVKE